MNSSDWKRFYAEEYARVAPAELGRWAGMEAMEVGVGLAGVFPHTRLEGSAEQVVPLALGLIASGAETVVALGPMHGGPAGGGGVRGAGAPVRGVHRGDSAFAGEEFCLDNLDRLLGDLARVLGRRRPRLLRYHPFLTGGKPGTMRGLEEFRRACEGEVVVATADVVHHGRGYGTPEGELREAGDAGTRAWVEGEIAEGIRLLSSGDYEGFGRHAGAVKSDFRDAGPVLREVFGGAAWECRVRSLELPGYEDVLETPSPTWVAAALLEGVALGGVACGRGGGLA
jgi:hypothetical protein